MLIPEMIELLKENDLENFEILKQQFNSRIKKEIT